MVIRHKPRVIIPSDLNPYPEKYEETAARLLAIYFQSDVAFVPRGQKRTPDFLIAGKYWELKSPTGNGKRTIVRNLQEAIKQSSSIIFDARRSKMRQDKFRRELVRQFSGRMTIKHLLLILKNGTIVELKRVK